MNEAIEYIEDNLSCDIDYCVAAKIMNCSEWEFRRIFSFLAQIPVSEYIRRRRLDLAAIDIKKGEKIIDVAIRYGYESQTAFSRAFSRFHGVAPSLARDEWVAIKTFPRLSFKLILMEGNVMKKNSNHRTNIIGAGEVGYAISIDLDKNKIHKRNSSFWDTKGSEVIGTTSLPKYGSFVSEEKLHLFGDVSGKKLLEIGCGSGQSLKYHGDRKASELWGIDISEKQIEKTREYLSLNGLAAKLICSPMEEECGIPVDYFDYVYSVYGIGWTTDLEGTFSRIASYLKKDGVFIFSWSHPIHKCVVAENDMLTFKKSYFDESWYSVALEGGAISLSDRKLSTYINALTKAGFIIEEMFEESDEDLLQAHKEGDFLNKAKMLPLIFVIKARKL
jgi:AraC-like DNA-binding protein/SAM-dependent methyltransferase